MSTTLPLYWNLSSADRDERINTSVSLISALQQFQAQFSANNDHAEHGQDEEEAVPNNVKRSDELDVHNAPDVSYAVRRLVRGLASPRESSRLGFAVALTELLSRTETITCAQVLTLIHDASQISGSMTGQEERDMLFARLFGLTALVQSGLMTSSKVLQSSSVAASCLDNFKTIVNDLVVIGEKKSWLKESSWWTLSLSVDAAHSSSVDWKNDALEYLVDNCFTQELSWTPETVALYMKLKPVVPGKDWESICVPPFKNADVLDHNNLAVLAKILKGTTDDVDDEVPAGKSQGGPWKPQLHFVWDLIYDVLLSPNATLTKGDFESFYRVVVDESLFSHTSSAQRKYWGFQLFLKALHKLPSTRLPSLFGKNFMRTWINHLCQKDRYLHNAAKLVASDLVTIVSKDSTAGLNLVLQLTGTNGSKHFDRVTKTKTIENLLASMDTEGIHKYLDLLLGQINTTLDADDDASSNKDTNRLWIFERLSAVVRNGKTSIDDDCVMRVLSCLVVNSLFVIERRDNKRAFRALSVVPNPPLSDACRTLCRTQLLSCLTDLTNRAPILEEQGGKKKARAAGVASDGELWISKLLKLIVELEKDAKHARPLSDLRLQSTSSLKAAYKHLNKLHRVSENQKEVASGAELLISSKILDAYLSEDAEQAMESLETCVNASSEMLFTEGSKEFPKDEDEATPIDVLTDEIIGLLEQPSQYWRTIGNRTFEMLSSLAQESTINLIISQLEINTAEDAEVDEDKEEEGSNASKDEEDGENGENTVLISVDHAPNGKDTESDDESDNDSSEEELLDDDQMMQIDEQLASVFRSRVEEKRGKGDGAQRDTTHFKNRVLDLVDSYLKKQPTSEHVLETILPLFSLITSASKDERQLADKATAILRSRIAKSKEKSKGVNADVASSILESVHKEARRVSSTDLVSLLSQCSIFVAKSLVDSDEAQVLRIYEESLLDFASKKASSLRSNFFLDFIKRFPNSAWKLRSKFLDSAKLSINGYRQTQIFQILHTIVIQSSHPHPEKNGLAEFLTLMRQYLHTCLDACCSSEEPSFSVTQLKEILKLTLQLVRWTKKTNVEAIAKIWEPDCWKDLEGKFAISSRFKANTSLPATCRQISILSTNSALDTQVSKTQAPSKRKVKETESSTPQRRKKVRKSQ